MNAMNYDQMVIAIFQYLDIIFNLIKPTRLVGTNGGDGGGGGGGSSGRCSNNSNIQTHFSFFFP